jgi:hypothetical protein
VSQSCLPKFLALKVHLYLHIVKMLLMCLQSQCTSIFHCCEPLLHLLFNLTFCVYEMCVNACIFPDNSHSRAILLQVMSWQNLFLSHNFAVYLHEMCHKLQYLPSQVLCNIIYLCVVVHACLPPCAFYLQKLCLNHEVRLSLNVLCISNTQLFMAAPVHFLSLPAPRGGGLSQALNWSAVKSYALSNPYMADSRS